MEFDFGRTDCDVWVFNEALSNQNEVWCPRADAVFQMHVETIWRNPNNRNDKGHADWLKTQRDTVVYMQEMYIDVPMSRKYPLEEVLSGLHINKRYITSSVAYALALASHLGYKRIELYGVEMETDTEYRYQRDGVTFWVGVAVGRGIEVELHCGMMESPLYGYEGDMKMDYSVFTDAIKDAETRLPEIQKEYAAKQERTAALIRQYTETGKDEGNQIVKLVQEQLGVGIQYGTLDGQKQEAERYQKKADAMIAKTNEFIFSRQEFDQARQALQKKQAELMTKSNVLAGQVETLYREVGKTSNLNRRRKRADDFVKTLDEYIKATITVAMLVGGLQENQRYIGIMDGLIKAAGGTKSEAVLLEAYENRRESAEE